MTAATPISNTLRHLRLCQRARAAGHCVAWTTDPTWLVNMAINRRARWPDDPGFLRGSAMPVEGRYPKTASDQAWRDLRRFARDVNTPRLAVHVQSTRHLPRKIVMRVAHRLCE